MSKNRTTKKSQSTKRDTHEAAFDLDVALDKYIWLFVPVLTLLYYWFSTGSTGFYQDDEIGHYRNIREFWSNPFSIMGNQPKPGWKILMVVPGLFGFTGVALAHCIITALTAVMTYKAARAIGVKNGSAAALFFAMQPLILQLSFRSYSEITAGLFVVLMVYFYYKEQYLYAALASSYIFSIRQEFALVSIGLGVIFLIKKRWIPFLALGWTPVVLGLIGWLHTGNIMWLIDDMRRIGLGVDVPHKPFWHYFETYISIVGPVVLALFLIGYWSFLAKGSQWKEAIQEHGFLFFTFTIMWGWSVFSAWDVPDFGANPGHWRYVLSISPLTAIYAAKGLNLLLEKKQGFALAVLGIFAALTLLFLSKETNGLILTDKASYLNFGIVLVVLGLVALHKPLKVISGWVLASFLLIGGIGYTLYAEKPRELDTEAATVKQAAEWYLTLSDETQSRPLYCNHVLFRYFADIDINDRNRDRSMFIETLEKAPVGSIVVWDSHYGKSQFGGDVPMEWFQDKPQYELLKQFVSPDQRFGMLVFEKKE